MGRFLSYAKGIDSQVVRKAQAGDEAATRILIESSQDRLFRFCMYLAGNPELAQDICQDTYLKVLEKLGSLQDPNAFMSWLFRAAKNRFLDHLKSRKAADERTLEDLPESVLPSSTPEYENVLEVRRVMAMLDPDERVVLLLIDLEGYSYGQAAETTGDSESAIRSRLHRARQSFRKEMKKT